MNLPLRVFPQAAASGRDVCERPGGLRAFLSALRANAERASGAAARGGADQGPSGESGGGCDSLPLDSVGGDREEDPRPDAVGNGMRPRRWTGLIPVLGAAVLAPAPLGLVPVFAPLYSDLFGVSTSGLGGLLAMAGLGGALASPVVTTAGDRLGHDRILHVSLLGAVVGAALCAAAPGYVGFAAGLFALGLFSTTLFASASALGIQMFPGKDRRVFSLTLAVSAGAGMFWPAAAQTIVRGAAPGSPAARILSTALPFGCLAVLLLLLRAVLLLPAVTAAVHARLEGKDDVARNEPAGASTAASGGTERGRREFLETLAFLCVLVGVHAAADLTLMNWMPTFLTRLASESGIQPLWILAPGYVLSLYSGAYLASRLLLSMLPSRMGRGFFLVAPGLAGGSAAALCLGLGGYVPAALGYVAAAFLFSFEYPAIVSTATERFPRRRGLMIGASSCVAGISGALVTWAAGIAAGRAPLRLTLVCVSLGFVLVGIGGWFWRKRLRRWDEHATGRRAVP